MFERTHAWPFFLLVGSLWIGLGYAFTVGPQRQYAGNHPSLTSNIRRYLNNNGDDDSKETINNDIDINNEDFTQPFESGSHSELMYTLGINLARQLGDIRPLVEDGDELVHVAKGLLDTVVGRLTEDRQKALLASRGRDLNALITERAYVD
jgi:hypothetical protein